MSAARLRTPLLLALFAAAFGAPPAAGAQAVRDGPCPAAETAESCLLRVLAAADSAPIEDALRRLREVCDHWRGDACYYAGRLLLATVSHLDSDSAKVWPTHTEAVGLFRRGCVVTAPRDPSGAACNSLGDAFAFGLGVPLDADSALAYHRLGCRLGNPTACAREADRMAGLPELGPGRFAAAERQSLLACEKGSPGGCASVAARRADRMALTPPGQRRTRGFVAERDEILGKNRRLCDEGKGLLTACTELGRVFSDPRFDLVRTDSARRYYEFGCQGREKPATRAVTSNWLGLGAACRGLAALALAGTPPDSAEALYFYRIGCELFDADACVNLGRMPRSESEAASGAYATLYLFVSACRAAVPSSAGCVAAGEMFERELADTAQARDFYQEACELDNGKGCNALGTLERMRDPAAAFKYFRRGCVLDEPSACVNLAAELTTRFEDYERAERLVTRACEQGNAEGCWQTMLARRRAGDEVQEGLIRARACRLDRTYCKNQDLLLEEGQ